MNRYTHEDYYNNPELFRRLAHRERARAIGEATSRLLRWIARLFDTPKASNSLRAPRWIARLG